MEDKTKKNLEALERCKSGVSKEQYEIWKEFLKKFSNCMN